MLQNKQDTHYFILQESGNLKKIIIRNAVKDVKSRLRKNRMVHNQLIYDSSVLTFIQLHPFGLSLRKLSPPVSPVSL